MASEYNMIMAILMCLEIAKCVQKIQIKRMSSSPKLSYWCNGWGAFLQVNALSASDWSRMCLIHHILNVYGIGNPTLLKCFYNRILWQLHPRSKDLLAYAWLEDLVFFLVCLGCSCVLQHPLIPFSLKAAEANLDSNFRKTSFLSVGN